LQHKAEDIPVAELSGFNTYLFTNAPRWLRGNGIVGNML
jgi:hypothetical protein